AEYRPIDGRGANPDFPEYGASHIHLLLTKSGMRYADGIEEMMGAALPNPRAVSNAIFKQAESKPNALGRSDFMWTWGQFLDHDLDLTEGDREPADIPVPGGDPAFDPQGSGVQKIPFRRAVFDPLTGIRKSNPRRQINQITAYIDASSVYGSDAERANWLRTGFGGRLKVTRSRVGDLLPFNDGTQGNAGSPEVPNLSKDLFVAGDIRANEQPTLAVMHTLFVREHNWQAERIARENPQLRGKDEELYQRARRIVIAEIQSITYNEFLPALLGEGVISASAHYNSSVNPGIAAVFSTAAYRLGHTLLSPSILLLGEDGMPVAEPLALRDAFFEATPPMLASLGIEPFLRGAARQSAQELDNQVIDEVRDFLFGAPGAGGLDLIALNIQRGRDMGLPDYNTLRQDYGLPKMRNFNKITTDKAKALKLQKLYASIDDIDPFVGMLCEDPVRGAMVGETLRTVLVDQFARLRDGDPFFYTRDLKGNELAEVGSTRLADIILRNTTIRNIQDNVFQVQ
ncbi:MAG: peroxidase family protein, partial [Gammaproteobacteria bacterium]